MAITLTYWSKTGIERIYINGEDRNSIGFIERRAGGERTAQTDVLARAMQYGLAASQEDDRISIKCDDAALMARIVDFVCEGQTIRDAFAVFSNARRFASGYKSIPFSAAQKADAKLQPKRAAAFAAHFAK